MTGNQAPGHPQTPAVLLAPPLRPAGGAGRFFLPCPSPSQSPRLSRAVPRPRSFPPLRGSRGRRARLCSAFLLLLLLLLPAHPPAPGLCCGGCGAGSGPAGEERAGNGPAGRFLRRPLAWEPGPSPGAAPCPGGCPQRAARSASPPPGGPAHLLAAPPGLRSRCFTGRAAPEQPPARRWLRQRPLRSPEGLRLTPSGSEPGKSGSELPALGCRVWGFDCIVAVLRKWDTGRLASARRKGTRWQGYSEATK